MTRHGMIVFFYFLTPAALVLAEDKPESWVGQKVMARRPDVKFVESNPDGSEHAVKMSTDEVKVLREKDGRLRIWSPGTQAWVKKEDMVLARDAPAYFTEYLRQNPKSPWGFGARGKAWQTRGELEIAIKDFTEVIRLVPDNPEAFRLRGNAWLDRKEYNKAIQDFDEAIRLDPKAAWAFNCRGNAWKDKKDHEKAIRDYDEAIRLDPKDVIAIKNRGTAWQDLKQYGKAIKDYDEAIRLNPNDDDALNGKAWVLAVCSDPQIRDGKRAIELATQACKLTEWKDADYIDTLAAACAATGQFDEAIKWVEKALQDSEAAKQNGDEWRARLKLYREKKPYQEN